MNNYFGITEKRFPNLHELEILLNILDSRIVNLNSYMLMDYYKAILKNLLNHKFIYSIKLITNKINDRILYHFKKLHRLVNLNSKTWE